MALGVKWALRKRILGQMGTAILGKLTLGQISTRKNGHGGNCLGTGKIDTSRAIESKWDTRSNGKLRQIDTGHWSK